MESINWTLVTPILVIQLILMTAALIDCIKKDKVNGPKWLWVLVIIFANMIGPVLYFIFGRKPNE
ncbi:MULTISPECIES: PLD nuclease N-terminal domain-containing protein [Alteribacter]|uniref:PLDc_N domain-containing protein n=1 Tax=Alteribacter keqinensis TaxID=2483800 RepID=A0A3M7U0I6_9BACI|nr:MULTISPECIES: PLD nuclease N-terminal domain-containing protein [Alteribacter]MBM7096258.1 PLDc_N domain-containing protein [Alteribacter salitolerans]RNA70514.1 PLDc_N domain-containing protein [Alteribacter keqinensis]